MIKLKEIVTKYKIYCDMDGVLTNFDEDFKSLLPNGQEYENGWDYEKKHGRDAFWKVVETGGLEFWSNMSWMPDGKILWDYIKDGDTELLSAPSRSAPYCIPGKKTWVDRELNDSHGKIPKLNLKRASQKREFASPTHILIDDLESNVTGWIQSGGIGILHTSAQETIKELQKLGV